MISGEWTGTMNLTEPQAGSDLALVRTRAEPQADGSYKIFGTKIFITYGEHDMAENIVHLVLARVTGAPEGVKGISLFVVPKFMVNADGSLGARNDVHCVSIEHKLGIKASPTAVLQFGDARQAPRRLPRRRGEPRPRVHVHHDERRALRGRRAGHRDRRARLPVGRRPTRKDRVQARPVDGSLPGAAPIIHHPDVQAHAADDARADRGLPRDGHQSPRRPTTRRTRTPTPRCASRARPSTNSWCRWSRAIAPR